MDYHASNDRVSLLPPRSLFIYCHLVHFAARHCGAPREVDNRTLHVTSEHYAGVATYQCLAGHVMNSTQQRLDNVPCNASGEWQFEPEPCTSKNWILGLRERKICIERIIKRGIEKERNMW